MWWSNLYLDQHNSLEACCKSCCKTIVRTFKPTSGVEAIQYARLIAGGIFKFYHKFYLKNTQITFCFHVNQYNLFHLFLILNHLCCLHHKWNPTHFHQLNTTQNPQLLRILDTSNMLFLWSTLWVYDGNHKCQSREPQLFTGEISGDEDEGDVKWMWQSAESYYNSNCTAAVTAIWTLTA